MNFKRFVLVTDLDGTFWGGSLKDRVRFYQSLKKNKVIITLIFATGRNISSFKSVFKKERQIVAPDYIIGDVGASVYAVIKDQEKAIGFKEIAGIQRIIDRRWPNVEEVMKDMLFNEPGICLQPGKFKNRVSYYYDSTANIEDIKAKAKVFNLDVLTSDNKYLDILPPGISKGSTLLMLIQKLRLNPNDLILCGDSLNDLSLFRTGLKSVALSNSEPLLKNEIASLPNVYLSQSPGVNGIIEGLEYYNKLKRKKTWNLLLNPH